MKISLNLDSIALLLFCSDIVSDSSKPLTQEEWFEVEKKLRSSTLKEPSRLFGMSKDALVQILQIDEYIAYKMMARATIYDKLMYALHNLQNEGINITTKYEDNYPSSLIHSLKKRSPLFLYYIGDLSILKNMVSIVGPQQMERKLQSFTKNLVRKLYDEDKVLVSSGAKGIETYALKMHLKLGGKAVCIVSDHMLDKKQGYNKQIKDKQMVLISAVDPYAFFNVTNALDRNIYVCGLSDYQFVTSSHINSGGIWFTSIQNFHYHWTTQIVYDEPRYNGNIRLLEMGALKISNEDILSLLTIDQIVEKNKAVNVVEEIMVDQMSIYEFIEE
ncbi:MAG: DNA-processing protein DprA [Bacilli bacterium]|nr:DNA-processing protein DprA [Bacilli bacterium]